MQRLRSSELRKRGKQRSLMKCLFAVLCILCVHYGPTQFSEWFSERWRGRGHLSLTAVPKLSVVCRNPETSPCPGDSSRACRGDINMIWSIGFTTRGALFDDQGYVQIQTGGDAGGDSLFLADPFLVIESDVRYIFTEILNNRCQKGEIGYHYSLEGQPWAFGGVVLAEDWHLSFPFIVKYNGLYYMTTCATAGTTHPYSLWLYAAREFPTGWHKYIKILQDGQTLGRPVDPVLLFHEKHWYLFVLDDGIQKERLFVAKSLFGPYSEHPRSTTYSIRHSGSIVTDESHNLWAFHHTGSTVERWNLKRLSPVHYEYGERQTILSPLPDHWASAGMHTFNAVHSIDMKSWHIVVDGWWNDHNRSTFNCLLEGKLNCQNRAPQ